MSVTRVASGPMTSSFALLLACEHQVERARVGALGDLQRDLSPAGLHRTPRFECASHPYSGSGCPGRVPVADEREEQCVAPEAEQITALVACFAQEVGERSEEDLGEFLGAGLALFRRASPRAS